LLTNIGLIPQQNKKPPGEISEQRSSMPDTLPIYNENEVIPPQLSSQLFLLLLEFLHNSANQMDMIRSHGFQVIFGMVGLTRLQVLGYLLGQLPPSFWNKESVVILAKLAEVVQPTGN
jgi:hypothetical protein